MENDWITIEREGNNLRVTCDENTSTVPREGDITITQDDTSESKTVHVTQLGGDAPDPTQHKNIKVVASGDTEVQSGSVVFTFSDAITLETSGEWISWDSANKRLAVNFDSEHTREFSISSQSTPLITNVSWNLSADTVVPVDLYMNGYSVALHEGMTTESADVNDFSMYLEQTEFVFLLNKINSYDVTITVEFPGVLTSYNGTCVLSFNTAFESVTSSASDATVIFAPTYPKQITVVCDKEASTEEATETTVSMDCKVNTWPIVLNTVSYDIEGEKVSPTELSTYDVHFNCLNYSDTITVELSEKSRPNSQQPAEGNEGQNAEDEITDSNYVYGFNFSQTFGINQYILSTTNVLLEIDDPDSTVHISNSPFVGQANGALNLSGSYNTEELIRLSCVLTKTSIENYGTLISSGILKGNDVQIAQQAYEAYQQNLEAQEATGTTNP